MVAKKEKPFSRKVKSTKNQTIEPTGKGYDEWLKKHIEPKIRKGKEFKEFKEFKDKE